MDQEEAEIIISAAIEFGPDYNYTIRNGTLGPSLYIDVGCRDEGKYVRQKAPLKWKGLYVIVMHTTDRRKKND